MPCLVVFAHQRWNLLHDRTQHLMSRLARRWPVLVVEEPLYEAAEPGSGRERLEQVTQLGNLRVVRLHTEPSAANHPDAVLARLGQQIQRELAVSGLSDGCLAWFCSPWAVPLLAVLQPQAVVYDSIDDGHTLEHPPRQWPAWERQLLDAAQLVFAPGPTSYARLRALHPNVHCLCNAVDAARFAPTAAAANNEHHGVRLGFHGVIDARIDLALLTQLAQAHPDWQIELAGPVVGATVQNVPQLPNLKWLGTVAPEDLPRQIAAWDACLLPYRIGAATRLVCPSATLQFLAAEKPVISTALQDVAMLYGDVVHIADGAESFVRLCETALAERGRARSERASNMFTTAARFSWKASADTVQRFIEPLLTPPRPVLATAPVAPAAPMRPVTVRSRTPVPVAQKATPGRPAFPALASALSR